MGRSPVKTRTPTLTAETWWKTTGLLALLAAVLSESPAKKGVILHRSLEKGPLSKESCFNLQALRLRYVADRFWEMMYNVKLYMAPFLMHPSLDFNHLSFHNVFFRSQSLSPESSMHNFIQLQDRILLVNSICHNKFSQF